MLLSAPRCRSLSPGCWVAPLFDGWIPLGNESFVDFCPSAFGPSDQDGDVGSHNLSEIEIGTARGFPRNCDDLTDLDGGHLIPNGFGIAQRPSREMADVSRMHKQLALGSFLRGLIAQDAFHRAKHEVRERFGDLTPALTEPDQHFRCDDADQDGCPTNEACQDNVASARANVDVYIQGQGRQTCGQVRSRTRLGGHVGHPDPMVGAHHRLGGHRPGRLRTHLGGYRWHGERIPPCSRLRPPSTDRRGAVASGRTGSPHLAKLPKGNTPAYTEMG